MVPNYHHLPFNTKFGSLSFDYALMSVLINTVDVAFKDITPLPINPRGL